MKYIHITLKMEDTMLYGLGKLNYTELRPNQRNVIKGYSYGKDVLFCSPTGSGNSLTFEIAPYLMSFMRDKITLPSVCCIVVSPLFSLMKTQEEKMISLGLQSLYLDEGDLNLSDIVNGKHDIWWEGLKERRVFERSGKYSHIAEQIIRKKKSYLIIHYRSRSPPLLLN